jgi:leucyl-tRNA synthetase
LHLLYSRFYVKVLYDLGYLPFDEPFSHLFNQGMVNKYSEKSGLVEKMSKSKGNVVNPDDIVKEFGSDALRMYILFMGPPELDCEWQDAGLEGIKRFQNRLWNYLTDAKNVLQSGQEDPKVTRRLHKFIRDYQERIDIFKPNTAISAFMEFLNDVINNKMVISKESLEIILVILSSMAPHMASELLEILLNKKLEKCTWPTYNPDLLVVDSANIPVQVNGKLRATLTMPINATQEVVEKAAREEISKWLEGKEIIKVIFVQNRMISFVIKL